MNLQERRKDRKAPVLRRLGQKIGVKTEKKSLYAQCRVSIPAPQFPRASTLPLLPKFKIGLK